MEREAESSPAVGRANRMPWRVRRPDAEDPLPAAVKRAREQRGLSQRSLAKLVGCSHVFVAEVERGRKLPSAILLERFQQELGLGNGVVMRHVHRRPIGAFTKVGGGAQEKLRHSLQMAGGSFDELTTHEKIVHLVLATGAALRSNGYNARARMPRVRDQHAGQLPSVVIDLEDGRKALITVQVQGSPD